MAGLNEGYMAVAVNGVVGAGKSTVARLLTGHLESLGVSVAYESDYPILCRWAEAHPEWIDYKNGDAFELNHGAYVRGGLSVHTTRDLGIKTVSHFTEGKRLVIVEFARGAGVPPDTYGEHFYLPYTQQLRNFDGLVGLVNMEVRVDSVAELERRVDTRYQELDGATASVKAMWKYLTIDGRPTCSSTEETRGLSLPVQMWANEVIDNSVDCRDQVEGIALGLAERMGYRETYARGAER